MLFYRKSVGFLKNRRTIQRIPHISMIMRGREVIASLWISWLLATLVIIWTSCRTLGQNSALWVEFVNSQWSAETSDCENEWWFEAWAILLFIIPHFYNAWSAQLQRGTRDFLCCDFFFFFGYSALWYCCSKICLEFDRQWNLSRRRVTG